MARQEYGPQSRTKRKSICQNVNRLLMTTMRQLIIPELRERRNRCREKQEAQAAAFACKGAYDVMKQDHFASDVSRRNSSALVFLPRFVGSMRRMRLMSVYRWSAPPPDRDHQHHKIQIHLINGEGHQRAQTPIQNISHR